MAAVDEALSGVPDRKFLKETAKDFPRGTDEIWRAAGHQTGRESVAAQMPRRADRVIPSPRPNILRCYLYGE
ncbi:hypothetical protein GCM10022223_21230 [Kineosporia mesophila]|uniref:Uncharacterized protein n=1 Tax=Kineosporia mesophila TaxID=566012 RepID=A0ABP6ZDM2_9ACTN